jgi:hypothetical protein
MKYLPSIKMSLPLRALALVALLATAGCDASTTDPGDDYSNQGPGEIVIRNNLTEYIYYVYIASCSAGTWGQDKLGTSTLPPGGQRSWSVSPGCYDVRVETSGGQVGEERNVSVGAGRSVRITFS